MKSTETASKTFIESNHKAMEQCLHIVETFPDITKAYDVHNHNQILAKLNSYGIRGYMNLWLKSNSFNHSQSVEITQTYHRNFT
jgi:hypothetical protein